MRDTIRILSIDGGGIRGIVPAIVLSAIENWTGQPVSKLFDLVAGTSTGGILALGLLKPGSDGRPAYSADDMAALYEREGRNDEAVTAMDQAYEVNPNIEPIQF